MTPDSRPPADPPPPVARALARLARVGAWDPADRRDPSRDPVAAVALLERLRAAGCAASVALAAPEPKSGRQLAPEYLVELSAPGGGTLAHRGTGSRLERAVWRAARALATALPLPR